MSSNSICTKPERRRCLWAMAMLLAGLQLCHAAADDAPWRPLLPQAQPVGGGDMTFLGLRVYRATLWSASRPFDATQPFALQLSYYRSISRQRLVNTSISEMRRLARVPVAAATLAQWDASLTSALVDVNEGDELTGVYQPGYGMRLYDRRRLLADIDDDALARAFFDIWLNPDSRDKKLRQHLMGGQP